jgi:hypothetical protein
MSAGGHHVLHPPSLPQLSEQVDRLIELGVHELGGLSSAELAAAAADDVEGAVLAVRPERVPPSQLAPLLTRDGKNGFVVIDMTDVDQFSSIDEAAARIRRSTSSATLTAATRCAAGVPRKRCRQSSLPGGVRSR